jgi:integrase
MTFSKSNNRPSTVTAKEVLGRVHLLPFFGKKRLDEIRPADIEAFKAQKLDEKQQKKSINNHLTGLRKLLNLAVEYEVLDRAPKVRGFKLRMDLVTGDQFLTFDEAERVLVAAPVEWKTFLVVALKTGLRLGELLTLKWEDLDLVTGQLVVRRTLWRKQEGPPKGGRPRTVPLSDQAVAVLKSHRALHGPLKSPYVFSDAKGKRFTHSMLKDVVPRACAKAGLSKRLTTHGLRHTFASHLVARGASLKAVQELLGHESLEMTLRYSHLTPDVRRDAVRLLDSPASQPQPSQQGGTPSKTEAS